MSIEQKIAELLEESAKLKLMEDTTEEVVEELEEEVESEEEVFEDDEDLDEAIRIIDKSRLKYDSNHGKKDGTFQSAMDRKHIAAAAKDRRKVTQGSGVSGFNSKMVKKASNQDTGGVRAVRKEDLEFSVQEDVDALLFGEDLTEEFKVKAATIFEAAVMARVNAEVETLEEAFEARLVEQAELDKEEIIEKVDGYLGYVVEQWMSDNEIAIENGLKSDILEGFVDGLKTLFTEHYIEVPEERFDIVGDLQEQVEFLESKLDESLEQNVQMMKELNEKTRDAVTGEFCSDMTDTEVEKFTALAEELSYEDADNFASKLQIIKENYFGKKPLTQVESVVTDSPVQLNEETKHIDANVARYLETFNRIK